MVMYSAIILHGSFLHESEDALIGNVYNCIEREIPFHGVCPYKISEFSRIKTEFTDVTSGPEIATLELLKYGDRDELEFSALCTVDLIRGHIFDR